MRDLLYEISEKINKMDINDICIDTIFSLDFNFDHKEEYKRFIPYEKAFWSNERIVVTDEDADYFLSIYDDKLNVHLKLFISYLIASCYKRQANSQFSVLCEEFIEMYFKNLDNITNGLPPSNLRLILNWYLTLFPKNDYIPNKYIDNILANKDNVQSMHTFICLLDEQKLNFHIKKRNCNHYIDLILHYKNTHDANFIYRALNSLLNVYTSTEDKKIIKKEICDYVLNNLDGFDKYLAHKTLNLVRDYMGELKYDDSFFEKIDYKLEEINKLMLDGLTSTYVKLPKEKMEEYKKNCELIDNYFGQITNLERVIELLMRITPIEIESIKKDIDDEKSSIFGFVNKSILRDDGSLINYKKLDKKEKFSLHGGRYINLNINIKMDLYYRAFLNSYKEQECYEEIKDLFRNNKLLSEDNGEGDYFRDLIIKLFEGEYDYVFDKLIISLEKSLRYYFKTNGLNIKKYSRNEMIGLTGFFNYDEANKFRDKLLETIDEDYYFTLTWLLTDEYGMNYRGNNFHGLSNVNISKTTNAIYTALLIIRLYLGFSNQ